MEKLIAAIAFLNNEAVTPVLSEVINLALVNTSNQQVIQILNNNDVLDLSDLPDFTIQAITVPVQVGSVKFELSGTETRNYTESTGPYLLFPNYTPWVPTIGNYSLTVTPFQGNNGVGLEGSGITISFEVKETVVVPDLLEFATKTALLNYNRAADVNRVKVTDPKFKVALDHTTNPLTADNILTLLCNNGGFWKVDANYVDYVWASAITDSTGDSAGAAKTAEAMHVKYGLPIRQDGYTTYIHKRADGKLPWEQKAAGMQILGKGTMKANPVNPTNYAEGYEMLYIRGNDVVIEGDFDGGKNNANINVTPSPVTYFVKWLGDGGKWYGNVKNAQGYGIQIQGDNCYLDSPTPHSNCGYTEINLKGYKNIDFWGFGTIHVIKDTPTTTARRVGVAFNVAEDPVVNDGIGGFIVKKTKGFELITEGCVVLFEGAVTALDETKSLFLEVEVNRWETSQSVVWTDKNGKAVSAHSGKAENVGTIRILEWMKITANVEGIQGYWFTYTKKFFCPWYYTNNFNHMMATDETVIDLVEFDRFSSLTPVSQYLFKRASKKVHIKKLIINNNNFNLTYVPSFALFAIAGETDRMIQIDEIVMTGGTGDKRLRLHNGTSLQSKNQFKLPASYPNQIIVP